MGCQWEQAVIRSRVIILIWLFTSILDMSIVYFADEDPTSVQQRGKHDFIEPDINTQPTHRIHMVKWTQVLKL